MSNIVVFNDLVGMLAKSTNTSQPLTESFLKELLALVAERLEKGEKVAIPGIGEFYVENGDIKFVPEKKLAEDVNYAFDCFEPVELDDEYSDESALEDEKTQAEEELPLPEEAEEPVPSVEMSEQEIEDDILPPPVPEEDRAKPEEEETLSQEPPAIPEDLEQQDKKEVEVEVPPVPDYVLSTEMSHEEALSEDYAYEYDEPKRDWKMFIYGVLVGIAVTVAVTCFMNWSGYINFSEPDNVGFDSIAPLEEVAVATDTVKPDTAVVSEDSVKKVEPVIYKVKNKSSYLSNISRKYYDHYIFWIYIYLENKDRIKDPDNLVVGMELVIPPAEKYGIDKDDPKSIERAEAEIEKTFGKKKNK